MLFPIVVLKAANYSKKFGFVSPIILCYAIGIFISNIRVIPLDTSLSMTISEASIPLAIPLVLFSTDFMGWLRLAKKTILSFCLLILCALASAVLAAFLFSHLIDEYWKIAGMLVGVYIGGTPNLMAVGMGLNVRESTLILVNASDTILGGIYLVFLFTIAKWLLGKFLPAYESQKESAIMDVPEETIWAAIKEMKLNEKIGRLAEIVFAFFLSVLFFAAAIGISILFTDGINVAPIMLIITSFGIGASFVPRLRNIKGTYRLGQYIILVFSLAIGSTVNLVDLVSNSSVIFWYTAFIMFVAIILHFILAAIFRIDTDTTIITSVAGIFGPAFIAPVAGAIKNREVVVPGLICGLVGYAVGNFFGFLLAYLVMPK